jgi:adhesin transport system outer membrane protein
MSKHAFALATLALAASLAAQPAVAQSTAAVKATVEKALAGNPEVAARFHAFRAASDGVDLARAGRGPRLYLTGEVGTERSTFSGLPAESLSRSGLGLQLTQVLWDGLGTQHEITRSGHERLSRWFELQDLSEQTALEAARALYDVQRYRKLVALAEDNVVQHRQAADKIRSRVQAGVGRGVDLEQANARQALAESNLATEIANLHDVSARYQRIVGDLPPADGGELAPLAAGLPGNATEALKAALGRSPAVSAAIESLRAARAAASTRQSQLQPRIEARVRSALGHNVNSVDGRKTDTGAEIVLNWNLFDGGADRARVRQQASLVNQASDLRDKACRDARQTAAIAYNDTVKLAEQLVHLDRNTQAIERARDAYRQQFDIGQRSLLDLLNAENEAYTARRALANAEFDRALALVRTHAAMNQLNAQLGLARNGQADEAAGWSAGDDAAGRCPIQAVEVAAADAAALARRTVAAPAPVAASAPVPAAAPAPVAAPSPAPAAVPAAQAVPLAETLSQRVADWAKAWESKDFARYSAFYAPGFSGSESSAKAWETRRRAMLSRKGPIGVAVDQLATADLGNSRAETRFLQAYTSERFKDTGSKTLTWQRIDGQWLIVKESNR